MRQGIFIKQNEEKWRDFEQKILNLSKVPADELSYIYVHLTEDLAYAKAKYPDTQLTQYLNELTIKVHNTLYKNKPEKKSRLITFWTKEAPLEMSKAYPYIGYSFLILLAGAFIGALSAANDKTFARLILGDIYVDMTLANIEKGDPMAVYKSASEGLMFLGITFNNIRVAIFAFAAGIFFSFGTGYILFSNGIMLGVFHYMFYEYGVFDENILSIWIHGTIEITAIIIAGGAGLVMGNSLLFPGTYPRAYSFRKGAKRGLKIVISLVPFFIVAGFLESFVTRHTELSFFVKIFIILLSLALCIFYLFILPTINKHESETYRTV